MDLTRLRELPVEKCLELVEDLWDTIAADQSALPLTEEQRRTLSERLDAYEADGNPGRPANEVMADIRNWL